MFGQPNPLDLFSEILNWVLQALLQSFLGDLLARFLMPTGLLWPF